MSEYIEELAEQAATMERERIIKLLEEVRGEISWDFEMQIETIIKQLKEIK